MKPRFNLPEVTFAEKSPQQIETELVTAVEKELSTTLAPADPRRKFLQTIVTILTQQRVLVDSSAKQNLLAYAIGDMLDHKGEFVKTPRLEPKKARTTVRFTLSTPRQQVISAGTRVTAGDGVFFETKADVIVSGGQTSVDIPVECTVSGAIGNGYLPGQINQLVDPLRWVQKVENLTTTEGGADEEDDDSYAERIRQAPEGFSTAGPEGAYVYWAKSASPLIVDVSVRSPAAGEIEIRPLLQNGAIPGQEILDLVYAACNDRTRRPLTDYVQVLAPEAISYNIELTYWIHHADSSIAASTQSRVQQAVDEYRIWQKSKLGRNIDPSELIARVKNTGAKRVSVVSPVFQTIENYQFAVDAQVTVTYGGLEND